jgi:ATP-dependent helicase/nuclease subunit A
MSERKLTDAQQAAAITMADRSVSLRSGAGCGKTFVLARRFTELLLRGGQSPLDRLMAVTFTDKAALEMTQRVRQMLQAFAAGAKGESRRKLLEWAQDLPGARISTIHGLCARLLRKYAFEAGLDPGFAVADDPLITGQMLRQAAESAVLHAVEEGNATALAAVAAVGFDPLVDWVSQLVDHRTQVDLQAHLDPAATMRRWQDLTQQAQQAQWFKAPGHDEFASALALARALPCNDPQDGLDVFRQDLLDRVDAATPENFESLFPDKLTMPAARGTKKAWGDPKACRDLLRELVRAIEAYRPVAHGLSAADERCAQTLACVCKLAIEGEKLFDAHKRSAGLLDFTDLLAHAGRLLECCPQVRRELSESLDQVLVDEAQDTDAFQINLLAGLIEPPSPQTPGPRMFIVGDAKQSIYRFRGARVQAFTDLCSRLGRAQDLDLSFRTHSAGVDFVNAVFGRLMPDYQPLKASRTLCPPQPSVEVLLAQTPHKATAQQATEAQATVMARHISDMVTQGRRLVWDSVKGDWRPVRYGDIAVLFSRMTNSLEYERRLAQAQVPYYVVGGLGFFRQQEVFDLLCALRAIDNPLDDIAFAGMLRSSLFGLDDNALMHIAASCERPMLPALRRILGSQQAIDGLSADELAALSEAMELIGRLHARKDAMGIADVMDEIIASRGYEAVLFAQSGARRQVGNVRLLMDRARRAQAIGMTLGDFLSQTEEMILDQQRYEQAPAAGEMDDVVRLMTVHRAKGLEFPVVILPDLNAAPQTRKSSLLERPDWGLALKLTDPSDDEAAPPLSYELAWRAEHEDHLAEEIRRLYVAVTRHEDHLVLIGAHWLSGDELRNPGSYIAHLDALLGLRQALRDAEWQDALMPYGAGHKMLIRSVAPVAVDAAPKEPPPGLAALRRARSGAELASMLRGLGGARGGRQDLPLVGAVDPSIGQCEIAVTALSQFERCPMRYRLQHELRVPYRYLRQAQAPRQDQPPPRHASDLDGATVGTVYHRCMELMDFAAPAPAAVLEQALAEMQLSDAPGAGALRGEFDGLVAAMRGRPLWDELASAEQLLRELDFVMDAGACTLRGQIDMLYRTAKGQWRIIDYKSDRTAAAEVAEHATTYELQMLAYAWAAARHLGSPPEAVTLYFLRPAVAYEFSVTPAKIEQVARRVSDAATQLVRCRRSGEFPRCTGAQCRSCNCAGLCG